MADQALCSIPSCCNTVLCRTWCSMHYQRWRHHGDPTAFIAKTARGTARAFLETTAQAEHDDCIPWPFHTSRSGYGMVWQDRRMQPASRISCLFAYGDPPTEIHEAAHSCNNRACVNARHLRWATPSENQSDRVLHGTSNRGERAAHAKLTADKVLEMRRLNREAGATYAELGKRFGVSTSTAGHAITGLWWKWLEG